MFSSILWTWLRHYLTTGDLHLDASLLHTWKLAKMSKKKKKKTSALGGGRSGSDGEHFLPPTFALLLSTTRMLHISTARIDTAIWTQWTVPSRWNSDVDPSGLGEM